jgi:hypothetical protein
MKKLIPLLILFIILTAACSPSSSVLQTAVAGTVEAFTPHPTYTPFPTHTPYPTATQQPTIAVTRVVVQTPTPNTSKIACKPITNMDYSDNSKANIMLRAYVALLPDVREVSYAIPERLYSNTLSQLVYISYVADKDGKLYSKRYIIYRQEFGWLNGVFSIDGQCWIDAPH